MKTNRILQLFLIAVLALSVAFAMCGCGDSGSSDSSGDSAAVSSDDSQEDAAAEKARKEAELSSKAVELNKDEENFYGKWVATSEWAKYLYGHLTVWINEDGTVVMDMTDEHLDGTWEKVDGGIHFENELFEGDCFYGKKCKMVLKEIEAEDEYQVTLKKVE